MTDRRSDSSMPNQDPQTNTTVRVPCGRCGYPLRGLVTPVCPECGADCHEPERPDGPTFGLPSVAGWRVAIPIAALILTLALVVLVLRPIR